MVELLVFFWFFFGIYFRLLVLDDLVVYLCVFLMENREQRESNIAEA